MASPDSPPSRYDALYRMWKLYLHMRCWGMPEYAELPEDERQAFAEVVRRGAVFRLVENCKREALAVGVELEDEWIAPLCASHLVPGEPLLVEERYRLDRVLRAMYTVLVRIDAQAPAEAPAAPAAMRVLRVYAGKVVDSRLQAALEAVESAGTVSERLAALHRAIPIPPTASADALADALGCDPSSVKKSGWWQAHRAGARERRAETRRDRLVERGQRVEHDG